MSNNNRMYRLSLLAIIVLSFALPLSSCAVLKKKSKNKSTESTAINSLEGKWVLSFVAGGDLKKLYKNHKPYIVFDLKNGLVSGNNSCNSFSGSIKVEGNKISYPQPFTQTLKACEGDGENIFMDALDKSKTFVFADENTVDFIGGDLGIMQFKREKSKH